jgi:hypothetical protein
MMKQQMQEVIETRKRSAPNRVCARHAPAPRAYPRQSSLASHPKRPASRNGCRGLRRGEQHEPRIPPTP